MLGAITHAVNIQERAGAPDIIAYTQESFPTLTHLFADGGYAGEKQETALQNINRPTIEIVKRPDEAKGFVVIARRCVVERLLPGSEDVVASPKTGKQTSHLPMHGAHCLNQAHQKAHRKGLTTMNINFESDSDV